jgi:AcrR family transcriptional regulator
VALSRDRIATAAIRLADAGGLDGVSVRKIATELGAAPMRLYDYFTGKQELLDLMVDAVYAEIADTTRQPDDDWRAAARAVAEATRAAALAHEWFADLLGGRPRLSPHALAVGELTAAALNRAPGVGDIDDLQRATGTLNAFLIGAIRTEVAERRAARSTGTDKESWRADLGPYVQRMLDTGRYPTIATLVHDATHHSAEDTFAQNLATVLDAFS